MNAPFHKFYEKNCERSIKIMAISTSQNRLEKSMRLLLNVQFYHYNTANLHAEKNKKMKHCS